MALRKNWISLQLSEAQESFKAAPEWMYLNPTLQTIRGKMDADTKPSKGTKNGEIRQRSAASKGNRAS